MQVLIFHQVMLKCRRGRKGGVQRRGRQRRGCRGVEGVAGLKVETF
jgi:hypothetical protein